MFLASGMIGDESWLTLHDDRIRRSAGSASRVDELYFGLRGGENPTSDGKAQR